MDKLELIPTINDAFWAIHNNDLNELKRSIRDGNFDINEENEFGETLLGTAIWLKNVPACKHLCTRKDINVNKTTKVFLGENAKNPEIVVSPLELAACVLPRITYGKSPFLDLKSKEICKLLITKNAKMPLEKYRKNPEFHDCLNDLREVVNSVYSNKPTKNDIEK